MIYFKNTHAFNLETSSNTSSLKYISTGGNIHFVILVGDKNPENLLKRYHNYIGPANIPPFWALGYHQSRWGYKSLDKFSEVVENFK